MTKELRALFLSATCVIGFLSIACPLSRSENPVVPVGPDAKADFLIYFHRHLSREQIDAFSKNVLSKPDPQGRGYYSAPGLRTQLRLRAVEGHEGIAITFFPNAPEEQRQELIRSIKASPLVYRVLENTSPDSVKTLK